MRALFVFALFAWFGCSPAGQPGPGPASAGPPEGSIPSDVEATLPAPADEPAEPVASEAKPVETIELTRGVRVETHGVRIMLRGTRTENRPDASSAIHAELEVRQGDDEQMVSLVRERPGEPRFVEAFDLELALESVEAFKKPSTAKILLR